jgi:hypothetical protein
VLAFQVEDVRAARKELESRGVEFVTDVEGNEAEAWAYFRGPDRYRYELWQPPLEKACRRTRGRISRRGELSVEARKRLVHRNPKSAI